MSGIHFFFKVRPC